MKTKKLLDDFTENLCQRASKHNDGELIVRYYDAINVLRDLLIAMEYQESKRYDYWGNEI